MKEIKNISIYTAILLLCSGLCACKKEAAGGSAVQNNLAKNLAVYSYIPLNGDTVYIPLNLATVPVLNTGFPAKLRSAIGSDVEVTAEIDTDFTLIQAFNQLYQVTSLPITQSLFKLVGSGSVTIKAGQAQSTDSLKIQLNKPPVGLKAGVYKYAVPLRLSSSTGGAVLAGNLMFIRVVVTVIAVINIDPRNSGLTGTRIDRSAWRDTASSADNGAAAAALDGDNTTSWISGYGPLPQWLQIDMGKAHTVKGFVMVPDYTFGIDFLTMNVLSSNDGVVWKAGGTYRGTATAAASSAANPDLKTVKFINPVIARYFKFNVTGSTRGNVTGMAEVYGVE